MKRRIEDRLAAILATSLLGGLVLGTWYLAVSSTDEAAPRVRALGHAPDYFVEGVAMIRVASDGRPVFRMLAEDMRHYPDDGSTEFTDPLIVSLDPERPTVRLTARRARTDAEGRITELFDEVVLVREAGDGAPRMTLETDYATVDSETETARTSHPVVIRRAGSVLQGTGMKFDNIARRLELDSEVRGQWQESAAEQQEP